MLRSIFIITLLLNLNSLAQELLPPDSLWFFDPTLYWSEVENADHYKVYRGRKSGEYGSPFSTTTKFLRFDDLIENIIYYFCVTSLDSSGLNESIKSVEVSNFHLSETYRVLLSWSPNSEADLAGYKVYWGTESQKYSYNKDVGNVIEDSLQGFMKDVEYYFAVTAYDTANNESDFSDEVSIILYTTGNFKKGDCNKDRKIDIYDLALLKLCYGANNSSPDYLICFDFDENGSIFIEDLREFKKVYGLIY